MHSFVCFKGRRFSEPHPKLLNIETAIKLVDPENSRKGSSRKK